MSTTQKEQCPVEQYYKGWNDQSLDEMAAALHPKFRFRGPMEQHESPASFLASCEKMIKSPAMKGSTVNVRARLRDNDQVVVLYDWVSADKKGSLPMAEYFKVADGKIKEIQLYFDTAKMAIPKEAL